jgi:putative heme-binding domain-containing protein
MLTIRILIALMAAGALFGQTGSGQAGFGQAGDAARGRAIFEGKGMCLNCHRVGEHGSRFGPNLTDIGSRAGRQRMAVPRGAARGSNPPPRAVVSEADAAIRARQELEMSILDPDADIAIANRTVRVVTKDGTTITGHLLNHDSFSVQLIDPKERLMSLNLPELREFSILKTSPMPSYRNKLSAQELADLVEWLVTLRGIQTQ